MRFGKAPRPTGVVLSVNLCTPPQVTSELSRVVQPRGAGEPMKHRTLKIETINLRVVARIEAARKIGENNGDRDAKANRQKHMRKAQRRAHRRENARMAPWESAGWLISKAMAHVERVGSYRMPRPHVSRWPRLGPYHAIAPAIV
jgi:hypothetical protein